MRLASGRQSVVGQRWKVLTKSGGAYTLAGANWPPNTPLAIIGHVANKAAGEVVDVTLGRATSDGAGAWSVQITPPRFPAGGKNDIEVRAGGQPYSVTIDF